MSLVRRLALLVLVVAPRPVAAQFVDRSIAVDDTPAPPTTAERVAREDQRADDGERDRETARDFEVRLTLSSFVHRELGGAAPPLVDGGAAPDDASPVRRFFGDARLELTAERLAGGRGRLHLDGRVRETTSERYQAGAAAGAEYELRTAYYQHGAGATQVRLGRQIIGAVGATRVDGVAIERALGAVWSATAFAGAYPQRGSRSIATDYPAIRMDGEAPEDASGAPLVPLAGGGGASYRTPALHGDLGVGAVHVLQEVPAASGAATTRVFTSASGYWRPRPWLDAYHVGVLDVAGSGGVHLTSGSLGVDVFPAPALELSLTAHHVDTELLEIGARNVLEDPDPAAMGIVQNDAVLVRVSQDQARAGASLALAQARFELSAAAGVQRRPAVDVPLTGGGVVSFPAASMAEGTVAVLDRRSLGGMRLAVSASVLAPIGAEAPSRSRGVVGRAALSRAGALVDLDLDVTAQRYSDLGGGTGCTMLDALACHGTARSQSAQAGALVTVRAGQEWTLLLDGHVGVRDAVSTTAGAMTEWPRVFSASAFARLAWRYR